MMILLGNRQRENLILVSANACRIAAAFKMGLSSIPLAEYQHANQDDFQLALL